MKLSYDKLKKIVETETNFYMLYSNGTALIVNKKDCKDDGEEFIRKINSKIFHKKFNSKKNKNKTGTKDNYLLLELLFCASIFCIPGALYTLCKIIMDTPTNFIDSKMWVLWLWVPIPILSIIIGFMEIKKNKKATNNIICGFIVSIILIEFGGISIVGPTGKASYDKIKSYEDVLMISIPKDGDYIQRRYEKYFDSDKKNVVTTEAFFKESQELKEFEQNIANNSNCQDFKTIPIKLKALIPFPMTREECRKCYITIYNEQLKEYNTVPENKDNYKIHVALYNFEQHKLEINTYEFE